MRYTLLFAAAVLWASASMIAAAQAGVNDYNNASLYPKSVLSMQFSNLLDASHSVAWADWGVYFGKDLPTANWGFGTGYTTVTIGHLLCHNSAGDAHLCDFEIQYFNDGGDPNCSVSSADGSFAVDLSSVTCPNSIQFALPDSPSVQTPVARPY